MKSSLNRIFKVIWSKVQMAWVAVSEATTAHGKQQSITRITRTVTTVAMLTGGAAIAAPPAPNQLPTGGAVAAGIAAIGVSGNTMTVTQSSNRAAINWNTFDIGSQAQVNFVQPSSQAVALNRVNSPNPSQIYGQLSSNGQVYLINAAGVYFAPGAQVNVGGIVATTMQMSDAAFMAGSTTFDRNGSTGKVINEGSIQTSLNGYIAMLAPEVRNSGLLLAQSGTVALAAGERITLNFGPTSKLDSITVTEAQLDTLVENRHAIKAPNGLVILSARAANQLAASVVNSGTIEAKGVSQQGGRILLEGSTVTNTGTLDVSSDTAQAGTIQINGKNVSISGNVIATSTTRGPGTQGGAIKVSATQSLNLTNANINASAANSTGGQIELAAHQITLSDSSLNADGDQGGTVQITATSIQPDNPFHDPLNIPTLPATLAATGFTSISSRGRRGQGGNVTLTGDHITLDGNTNVNVSGATGGGNALVGGDWQGSNGIYQATTVTMGANTSIDASATDTGNGGKVVLWSDIHNATGWTNVHGSIYAKGGANGGDGGNIETSGHSVDNTGVSINAGSTLGQGGLWLIDPYDYTINAAAAINIVTALNTGTSVNVNTSINVSAYGGGASGLGNISVDSAISWSGAGSLTLTADNNIVLNANISATNANAAFTTRAKGSIYTNTPNLALRTNGGDVLLASDTDNSGSGMIALERTTITTSGGNITLGGGDATGSGYAVGANIGTLANGMTPSYRGIWMHSSTLNAGGGNIVLRGKGGSAPTGYFAIGVDLVSFSAYSGTGNQIQTSGSGTLSITGIGGANTDANNHGAGINFYTDSGAQNFTTVNGSITLTGTNGTGASRANVGINNDGGTANFVSTTGDVSLRSVGGGAVSAIHNAGTFNLGGNGTTNTSGNLTITADNVGSGGTYNVRNTGTVLWQSDSASFSAAQTWDSRFTLSGTQTGLTIGKTTNTADLTIGTAVNITGPINLYGGNISLNADINANATGSWLSLYASGNVTQGAGKVLSNDVRFIGGGGNLTLDSAANLLKTLAASGVANMTVNNSLIASALALNAIDATGNIKILNAGSLVLNGNVSTTSVANSTSVPALLVAAGYDQAAGTGGFSVLNNGGCCAVNVGIGGLGLIYTGTVGFGNLNSIPGLASGSGNFRYNTTYSASGPTAGFTAPLTVNASASNLYVLYRQQPTLTVTANTTTSAYGSAVPTPGFTSTSQNGDTIDQIFGVGNGPTVTLVGNTSTAGFVVAGNATLVTAGPSTNLLGYATPTYNNGTAVVTKANLTVSGTTVANKEYDGNTTATFTNNGSITPLTGLNGTDVVTLTASGNFTSKNAGNGVAVTMTDSLSGADAGNYNIIQPTATGNITPKTVTLSAQQGYTGSTTLSNVTIGGLVGSETLTYTGATANSSQVADNSTNYITAMTLGNQSGATASSGGLASNYQLPTTLNHSSAPVTITQANLLITANNTSTQYGLGTTLGTTAFTTTGLQNSETVGNVTLTSAGSAATADVGPYSITASAASGGTFSASNYNISYANGTLTVTQAPLTLTANALSRAYGASNPTTDTVSVTSGQLYNGNLLGNATVSSTATGTLAAGQTANLTPSAVVFSNGSASNYNITYVNGTLSITQAPLGIAYSGTYNGTTGFNNVSSGYTFTGLQNGETISSANLVVANANVAYANNYVTGLTVLTGNASMGNYVLNNAYNSAAGNTRNTVTLAAAPLTITAQAANMTYSGTGYTGGNVSYSGFVGSDTASSMNGTMSYGGNSQGAINAGNYTITASGQTNSNYIVTYNNGVLTINPAPLGIAAAGVYSGTTTVSPTSYTITGLQNGETVTSIASVTVNNPNVAATTNGTQFITGIGATTGTADLSNYQINGSRNSTPGTNTTNVFTMARANLTVTPNNNAIFIGEALPSNSNANVSYSGLVGGQTAAGLITAGTLTAGSISNSAGTVGNTSVPAGSYNLTATGWSADNYTVSYANGSFVVSPADALIVQVGSQSMTYGTSLTTTAGLYGTPTVRYMANGSPAVTLTQNVSQSSGNHYVYDDGMGGSVAFNLTVTNGSYSTSNNLAAGSGYQLGSANIAVAGPNLNLTNGTTTTGAMAVNAMSVTASTTNVSKQYDGTRSMSGLTIDLTPAAIAGDDVTTGGAGAFSQANAGTNLSYNVTGLALTGADAGNYVLTGGTSFSGNNGVITPRTVTLSGNQTYSGNTVLTNVTIGNLVGSETLTYTGNAFSKNVQDNGTNYIANLTLGNGANGGLSSNYQLPTLNHTNAPVTINRLNSVTWTGGTLGNWFDPANWAGGAVPDLNNVANVVIPNGITVTFNTSSIVPPAQLGTVSIDSLGGAGGNLTQTSGTLDVGSGGITLGTLTLQGGNLSSQGSVMLTTYNQSNGTSAFSADLLTTNYLQSGGNTTVNGNLNAQTYNQSGGSSTVLGALTTVNYLQSNGTTTVTGNLTSGNMTLTGGDTVALSNLVVTNTLDQQAGNLSVTGNTTAGNISLSGGNLTGQGNITAGNLSQTNGTLTANSNLTVNGTYSLGGGNASIAGNLQTQTYNQSGGSATILGAFSSTNYLQSNGTTTVTGNLTTTNMTQSGGNTTTLSSLNVNGSYNQTGGRVNVTGSANITTTGTMTLGNLTVGGALNAHSTGGNINQTAGTQMSVTGRASFFAPNGVISLNPNNSFPGGNSIIDHNGDRNRPATSTSPWIFQQTMVAGGTTLFIPLPKNEVKESRGTHRAMAFTGDVILLADEAPEKGTDPGFMATPEAGFTDRFFDAAPRITLLPSVHTAKVVQHGDRLLIVDTDGPRLKPVGEEGLTLPQPGLQLSTPDEITPAPVEKISRLFP